MKRILKLGVNIDHIASLRQLRFSKFPDILEAAKICEKAGADSIVVHLREDRRHIQDKDVWDLRRSVKTKLNLEMSINQNIVDIACRLRPDQSTLVPEKRRELTTEGGLDVAGMLSEVSKKVSRLKKNAVDVSLFIEPVKKQISAALKSGAGIIELHTGRYANSKNASEARENLKKLSDACEFAHSLGLVVNSGHGLDFGNVLPVAKIKNMNELNIGYSIICSAVFVGLERAVKNMKKIIERA